MTRGMHGIVGGGVLYIGFTVFFLWSIRSIVVVLLFRYFIVLCLFVAVISENITRGRAVERVPVIRR